MRVNQTRGISTALLAVIVILALVVATGAYAYYSFFMQPKAKTPLIVYSADLYTKESSYLYSGFANSTGLPLATPKAGGSTALATQIAQGAPVSVFLSVSKTSLTASGLGSQAPGWGVAFAADQMVLGYSKSAGQPSGFQQVLNAYQTASASNSSADWRTFFSDLTSGAVKVGISNPNADPAGFRGWLVLEGAGLEYVGNSSYFADRLLASKGNVTASSAADLVAPLQAGNIQFLFMYKSSAISDGISVVSLPSEVNLGDPAMAGVYSQFSYKTTSGVETGAPILLFVTVPKNSTQTAYALQFAAYVIQHSADMASFGMVPLTPAKLYNSTDVPAPIAQLLSQATITASGPL